MRTNGVGMFLLALAAGAAAAATALAEAPAATQTQRTLLEEIVVTAQRREAAVQDTALSISAFSDEVMQARGIQATEDLHYHVPNFYYSEPGQAGITQIAIRGIGNENVTAGGDPGVAYHFDGVYLGRPGSALADMWDVERVEVLRGPQGTLYGRNATGGSINVVTKKPTNEFDAVADVLLGNYDRLQGRFAIGGAIVEDRLMARVSGFTNKRDGYIENLVDPLLCPACEDTGAEDAKSVRAHVLVKANEATDVLFTVQRFEDQGRRGFTSVALPGQRSRGQPDQPRFDAATPNPADPRTIVQNTPERFDMSQDLYSVRIDWQGEGWGFTSLTSYSELEWDTLIDQDNSDLPLSVQIWGDKSEQWVQEFQLTTNFDGPWQGILGLFYFEEDVDTAFFFQDIDVFTFINGGSYTTKSFAPFANVSYDFAASGRGDLPLRVTAGLRWTRDEKTGDDFQIIPEFGVDLAKQVDETWTEFTWDLAAQYYLGESTMAYATISRGYKSGGALVGNFPGEYDPESIISYEMGIKSQIGQRYQVNASAFYYDYEDLQLFLLEAFGARIDNAADADISGVEVEFLAEPVDNLLLNMQLTWLDAELQDYVTIDDTMPELGPQDLSGNRPNRAPKYTVSIGAQYTFGLGEFGTLTPRVDYYWQDDVYLRPQNLDRDRQSAYHRTNARLTWEGADGRWSAQAFVENIEDDDVVQNLALGSGSFGYPNNVTLFPPRMYGLRLGWSY
jgi:iron complex outermembrane recepter protein